MENGKLVRDRIQEIIKATGVEPAVRTVDGEALLAALFEKLREEADELRTAQTDQRLEELADVLEVVRGLALHLGFDFEEVVAAADRKRDVRGGFVQGLWLVAGDDPG